MEVKTLVITDLTTMGRP